MQHAITTHVCGDYWQADGRRSELGRLIRRGPEDHEAFSCLVELLAPWFKALGLSRDTTVVAVPAGPCSCGTGAALAPRLASALASAAGHAFEASWLTRSAAGPRIRDLPEARRSAAVTQAGYQADEAVEGRRLVLVDDVVLSGATTQHVAELALRAGAASVVVAVAARTRRAAI